MDITLNIATNKPKPLKTPKLNQSGRSTETISNRQSVNPSFVFSWDSSKKDGINKSSVVARKRATATLKPYVGASSAPSAPSTRSVDAEPLIHVTNKKVQKHKLPKTVDNEPTAKKSKRKPGDDFDDFDANVVAKHRPDKKTYGAANQRHSYSLFSEKPEEMYVNVHKGVSVCEKVFARSGNSFSELNIGNHLVSNLTKYELTTLTTVQEKAIPVVLSGKNTLIRSQTGSGKTLTYAVPIIDALHSLTPRLRREDGVQAIIVVPTRELALQTRELFTKINTFQWVVTGHLCGGENRKAEKKRLRKGINVLISTPGRLLDHVLHTTSLKIDKVRCLVLDEADRLLDMGFRKDIVSLVEALDQRCSSGDDAGYDAMSLLRQSQGKADPEPEEVDEEVVEEEDKSPLRDVHSKRRQTILVSATLTKDVIELAEFAMKEHVFIDALEEGLKTLDNKTMDTCMIIPDSVKQEFVLTYVKHRLFTLSALLVANARKNAKTFVFMASGQMVEYHYELFNKCLCKMPKRRGKLSVGKVAVLEADSDESTDDEETVLDVKFFKLHGSMDQKQRRDVFTEFRGAKNGILICTDVAARGIDVPQAECIIQYTGPQTDEDYLHRVGRTGRAGKTGSAIIFLTHDEQEYVSRLQEQRVFLKECNVDSHLKHLCDIMEEPTVQRAAEAVQKRFETAVARDKSLYTLACFAYSTWSRFYNSYPAKMRAIFDFKKANLGHYVTSFALRDTPSSVARVVRGQVATVEQPRLNRKLDNHKEDVEGVARGGVGGKKNVLMKRPPKVNKAKTLLVSEFASGLPPSKKKKKNKD